MKPLKQLWGRLRCLPIRHYLGIEGWLTPREARALYDIARNMGPGAKIVEIGSWKGKSTFCLAKGLRDGTIIAIDPFDASGERGSHELYGQTRGALPLIEQFKHNLGAHGLLGKIEVKQGFSRDFAGTIRAVDFLFIDGDHSQAGCEYDFRTFSPEVKSGGLLAFHDYNPSRMDIGPTWVIETMVRKMPEWTYVGRWDSLAVFRRQ